MSSYPVVKLPQTGIEENTFNDGDKVWYVSNLICLAKNLPQFDLPLIAIDSGREVWSPVTSAYALAKQMRRVLDLDPEYPVILDELGFIMDGWHRIARALIEGKETVRAVRFDKTPPCDFRNPKS